MELRGDDEQADMPDAFDKQVLDQVGHGDQPAFRVIHADEPYLVEAPIRWRRGFEGLLRGVRPRRLALDREVVLRVLLEEVLQRRQVAGVHLERGRATGSEQRLQAACSRAKRAMSACVANQT